MAGTIAELLKTVAQLDDDRVEECLRQRRESGQSLDRILTSKGYLDEEGTLKLFSEQGIVKELSVDSTRKFYDSTTTPHHHFFHVDSGRLTDIPDDQVRIGGLPPLPPGTEQESVEVLIRVRNK